ncbi:MAG TPA: DUF952 domain-containing protein [Alphaproteobacteria bacterium]|jgi:uncharacterized protein (DUF952 family)
MTTAPASLPDLIFHICPKADWQSSGITGSYAGSSHSRADGYLHFSLREQLAESFARHFPSPEGLVVLAVSPAELLALGADMRWEVSRGGALFPHLYSPVPVEAVVEVRPASDIAQITQ